jgi:hypothetical protein
MVRLIGRRSRCLIAALVFAPAVLAGVAAASPLADVQAPSVQLLEPDAAMPAATT